MDTDPYQIIIDFDFPKWMQKEQYVQNSKGQCQSQLHHEYVIRMLVLQILKEWRQNPGFQSNKSLVLIYMVLSLTSSLVLHTNICLIHHSILHHPFSLHSFRMCKVWLHIIQRRHFFHILYMKLCTSKKLG